MTAYAAPLIQDADDGPGELNTSDDGKVLFWDGAQKRFLVGTLRSPGGQIVGHFGGFSIQTAQDGPGTLAAGDDGKALVWNQATGRFQVTAVASAVHIHAGEDITSGTVADARIASTITRDSEVMGIVLAADGSGSGLDADLLRGTTPTAFGLSLVDDADATAGRATLGLGTIATEAEANYLLASGARTGAASQRQAFTNGISVDTIQPIANGNAPAVQSTAGTSIMTWDTTNLRTVLNRDIITDRWLADPTLNLNLGVGAMGNGSVSHTTGDTGYYNVALGNGALNKITTGFNNFGLGVSCLFKLTTGAYNIGIGASSLFNVLTSNYNIAIGTFALTAVTGASNIAIGHAALSALTSAQGCVGIGDQAGSAETASNRLHIGNVSTKSLLLGDFNLNRLAVGFTDLTAPTAVLHLAPSTTAQSQLRFDPTGAADPTTPNDGDAWKNGAVILFGEDATTNAIVNHLRLRRDSTGTPAAGFGAGLVIALESSTTPDQDAGRLTWQWDVATHASRASKGQLTAYYTSTERPVITWGANSSVALLSFYDVVTPIARQVLATGAGATVDNVITALQNLGLVKQS